MTSECDRFWTSRRLADLNLILWASWNPICSGSPTDEYTGYVGRIGALLDRGASESELEEELRTLRTENMGLTRDFDGDGRAADRILTWYCEARGLPRPWPLSWKRVDSKHDMR